MAPMAEKMYGLISKARGEGSTTKDSLSKCRLTFRLETLNPTSAGVIPIRLKKVTMEDISSASA